MTDLFKGLICYKNIGIYAKKVGGKTSVEWSDGVDSRRFCLQGWLFLGVWYLDLGMCLSSLDDKGSSLCLGIY